MTIAIQRGNAEVGNPHFRIGVGDGVSTKPMCGGWLQKSFVGVMSACWLLSASAADLPWKDITGTNRVPDSVRSVACATAVVAAGVMRVESDGANIDTKPRGVVLIVR